MRTRGKLNRLLSTALALLLLLALLPGGIWAAEEPQPELPAQERLSEEELRSSTTPRPPEGRPRLRSRGTAEDTEEQLISDEILEHFLALPPETFLWTDEYFLQTWTRYEEGDTLEYTEAMRDSIFAVAQEITAGCSTDAERIEAVAYWMAGNVGYDHEYLTFDRKPFPDTDPYMVLQKRYSVCDGYAKTSEYLLQSLGIPCVHVGAPGHAFNYAYDGSRWIFFDATWMSNGIYADGTLTFGTRGWSGGTEFFTGEIAINPEWYDAPYAEKIRTNANHVITELPYSQYFGKVTTYPDYAAPRAVTLDDTVTEIGEWAFSGSKISALNGGKNLVTIGKYAFFNCTCLTSITLWNKVETIGEWGFGQCGLLSEVKLGTGLRYVDKAAFYSCGSLNTVAYAGTAEQWSGIDLTEFNYPLLNAELIRWVQEPAAPTVSASAQAGKITVTWDPVPGATKYALYRRAYNGSWSSWKAVSSTLTGTSFEDTELPEGTQYQYRMKAYSEVWSGYSAAVTVKPLSKPAAPAAAASFASDIVTVTWGAVSGATKYALYRRAYTGSWSSWKTVSTALTGTSYADADITPGVEYQYRMKAYNGLWSDYGAAVNVKTNAVKPAAPALTVSFASGKVTVKWNAVSGASKYSLYRREYSGSWSSWTALSTSLTGTSYTDADVTAGQEYQYRMKAYNGLWSDWSAAEGVKVVTKPAVPAFTVSYEDGAMHVAWTAVSGAKKYALYRSCYKNGAWTSWTAVNTKLTGTSCTDPGVEEGYRYQYRMKAYNGLWSDYTPVVNVYSVSVPLAAPVISASAGSGKITVTWDSVEGGIKYAVYRAAYEDGKWGKWTALSTTVKGANISYEDKTAQAGVKYQYRMKVFNGLWSIYSNTVTVIGA